MSWIEYYVDPADGDDSNSGTSTGTPWRTLSATFTNIATTGLRRIYLSNTEEFVIDAPIATSYTATPNVNNLLQVVAWDNSAGEGYYMDTVDGRTIPAWRINGSGQAYAFTTTNKARWRYLGLIGGRISNTGTSVMIYDEYQTFMDMEFVDNTGASTVVFSGNYQQSKFQRCKFLDQSGGCLYRVRGEIRNNHFENCGSSSKHVIEMYQWTGVSNNVFLNCGGNGRAACYTSSTRNLAINQNTFILTDGSVRRGIQVNNGSANVSVAGNVFVGYNKSTDYPVYVDGSGTTGPHFSDIGNNAFYDCLNTYYGTEYPNLSAENMTFDFRSSDLSGGDSVANPFEDSTAGDFRPTTDSVIFKGLSGYNMTLSATGLSQGDDYLSFGAYQQVNEASSGGDGTSIQIASMHIG